MTIKEIIAKMNGQDAEKIAKAIAQANRQNTVEKMRAELRKRLFDGGAKRTKTQQIAVMYEYLRENETVFNNWLREKDNVVDNSQGAQL